MKPENGTVALYPNESLELQLYIEGTPGQDDSFRSTIYDDQNQTYGGGYIFQKKGVLWFRRNTTIEESAWRSPGSMAYTVMVSNGNHSRSVAKVTVQIDYYYRNNEFPKSFRFDVEFSAATPASSTQRGTEGSPTVAMATTGIKATTGINPTTGIKSNENRNGQNQKGNGTETKDVAIFVALGATLMASLIVILVLGTCLTIVCQRRRKENVESQPDADTSRAPLPTHGN